MKIDAWYRLRTKRNQALAETDKYMLSDFPVTTTERAKYKDYRQYLRDCPKMFNDQTVKDAKIKTFEEWLEWKRNGTY
jgi:hypothetical protein